MDGRQKPWLRIPRQRLNAQHYGFRSFFRSTVYLYPVPDRPIVAKKERTQLLVVLAVLAGVLCRRLLHVDVASCHRSIRPGMER